MVGKSLSTMRIRPATRQGGHLIAPGPNVPRGIHVGDCQCRSRKGEMQTCPKCRRVAIASPPSRGAGMMEAGCTARPFDAVWVRLSVRLRGGRGSSLAESAGGVECGHDVVEFDPATRCRRTGGNSIRAGIAPRGEQIDEDERR